MLTLPFFGPAHRDLAGRLADFARESIEPFAAAAEDGDAIAAGRGFIERAGAAGVLKLFAGDGQAGPELRALCLAREAIAACSGFADSVYAVQGLGCYPIVLAGSDRLKRQYLPDAARGTAIGAFALTEPGAGSDPAGIETEARREGSDYVISGTKTVISNAGRAPHPIGELRFDGCRVPVDNRLGAEGGGLKIALSTLDLFRSSVGAAACGISARALQEAANYAQHRRQFGSALSEFQATKIALADMATELDASRLLVYRAAWTKDGGAARVTRESSMAKLFATEAAQRIVDRAVQIHGGLGVTRGSVVERLYREVRALRIYEGTSEIQRLVIAEQVLSAMRERPEQV
jgi:acyl-CoA dehydrogenase